MVLFSCEALVNSVKHHLIFAFLPPLLHFPFSLTHPAWGLLHLLLFHPPRKKRTPSFPDKFCLRLCFLGEKWDETFSATLEGNGVRLDVLSFFDCYAQNFVFFSSIRPPPLNWYLRFWVWPPLPSSPRSLWLYFTLCLHDGHLHWTLSFLETTICLVCMPITLNRSNRWWLPSILYCA